MLASRPGFVALLARIAGGDLPSHAVHDDADLAAVAARIRALMT